MPEGDHVAASSPSRAAETLSGEAVRAQVQALYEAHGAELRRFVLGVVKDPEVAADVLQATLSTALERGHSARPESFKGWLFRVAYHEALAHRRRDRAGQRARQRLARLRTPADAPPTADAPLIAAEAAAAVRRALADLPESQRLVVVARIYDDKTFAEIAAESGLPLGTVLTRMRRALARLRGAISPTDPEGSS